MEATNVIYITVFVILIILLTVLISSGINDESSYTQKDFVLKTPVYTSTMDDCDANHIGCNGADDDWCGSYCGDNSFKCLNNSISGIQGSSDFCVRDYPDGEKPALDPNNIPSDFETLSSMCYSKHGGQILWTGEGEGQGWTCSCAWPDYAAGDAEYEQEEGSDKWTLKTAACENVNPGVCGGENAADIEQWKSDWDAKLNIPEEVDCNCKSGYILLRSIAGGPQICAKEENLSFYKDLYYNPLEIR